MGPSATGGEGGGNRCTSMFLLEEIANDPNTTAREIRFQWPSFLTCPSGLISGI